nr:MAG TPA: hypothetical protein [Caudoviricetes sp.]
MKLTDTIFVLIRWYKNVISKRKVPKSGGFEALM